MKTLILVRGNHSSLKETTLDSIMKMLNPNVNTVRAMLVDINRFKRSDQKEDLKAADRTCKNLTRKLLGGHQEEIIVVSNGFVQPQQWQSYTRIADQIEVPVSVLGIDVLEPQDDNLIFQEQYSGVFNAFCYKYYSIKNKQDIHGAAIDMNNFFKRGEQNV